MAKLSNRWGRVFLLTLSLAPGLVVSYFPHSAWWMVIFPAILVILMAGVAALPIKKKITPQEWANDLEKHLLGTEGSHDWDDATSVTLADPRLENLRWPLVPEFDLLDTPEKLEGFRRIIEALRRGEMP